ncbi:MAG: 4a-hydroxytetrahydrobiopterin dehydratase [Dokdonella sp.]
MSKKPLHEQHCQPRKGAKDALAGTAVKQYLGDLEGWKTADKGSAIHKLFEFKNYYHTMAFVNAVAWIAHREDHHPDLEVGYSKCRVRYSTHDVGGLSLNDFISAAKVDHLLAKG